jgi:hypothetical protein
MTSVIVFVDPPELPPDPPDVVDEFDELPHALSARIPMTASADTPMKRTVLSTDASSRRNDVVNFVPPYSFPEALANPVVRTR